MRIVFPLINLSMSGGVRIALQYATGLANRNHQVTLIVPDNAETRYFSLPGNIILTKVPVSKLFKKDPGYPALVYALAKAIPKCDVVFSTSWQTVYPALIVWKKDFRIFHLIQHDDEVINSERSLPIRWRNNILYRYIYRLPVTKIVVSGWLQNLLWVKYRQRSICIPNGVDHTLFNGAGTFKWTPPTETFDILCTARNVRWKGFGDIVDALRLLVPKYPDIRLIAATQENMKVPPDLPIEVVHPRDDSDMVTLFRTCSVFVCSSWQEGFGLPPLEAMACGAPVITTDCGGVNDFARDKNNCLIVPIRKPELLADAVMLLRINPALAKDIASNGLETAKEFTMVKAVDKLDQLLVENIMP